MNSLAIDTSTRTLSLALAIDGRRVIYRNEQAGRRMADVIVPRITRLLHQHNLELDDIDTYVVGLGPGSFTGLRVGVATVKGLCFGTDTRVVGISSLDAVAIAVTRRKETICVITDARRGLLYSARYQYAHDTLKRVSDYQLVSWDDLRPTLPQPVVFCGDGVTLYKDKIIQSFGEDAVLTGRHYETPQARFLLPAGLERLEKDDVDDIATLEPLYLYGEDCQVR